MIVPSLGKSAAKVVINCHIHVRAHYLLIIINTKEQFIGAFIGFLEIFVVTLRPISFM